MVVTEAQQVLVTGASGFIGGHLRRHLREAGYSVRGFSRSPAPHQAWDAHPQAQQVQDTHPAQDTHTDQHAPQHIKDTHVQGDILDRDALDRACAGIGTVFHLAGVAGTADRRHAGAVQVNVEGARNLLAAAQGAGVGRLICISSALAAELDESSAPPHTGDYARSKWQAERLVLEADGKHGMSTVVLRPAPVYGPGMKGGLARMISLIHARRMPPLPRLDYRFSLAGVDDVCRAAILAAKSPGAMGQCWLLTDLHDYQANAIERATYEALGRKNPRWRTPAVVFFAAAALLQLGRLAGWKTAESGLQTWRNMTRERTWPARDIYQALDFSPAGTLYEQLPDIIRELTGKQAATRE